MRDTSTRKQGLNQSIDTSQQPIRKDYHTIQIVPTESSPAVVEEKSKFGNNVRLSQTSKNA